MVYYINLAISIFFFYSFVVHDAFPSFHSKRSQHHAILRPILLDWYSKRITELHLYYSPFYWYSYISNCYLGLTITTNWLHTEFDILIIFTPIHHTYTHVCLALELILSITLRRPQDCLECWVLLVIGMALRRPKPPPHDPPYTTHTHAHTHTRRVAVPVVMWMRMCLCW